MYPYSVYTYIPTHPLYAHTQRERNTRQERKKEKDTLRFVLPRKEEKKRKKKNQIVNQNKGKERGEQGSDSGVKGCTSGMSAGVDGVDIDRSSPWPWPRAGST